MPALDLSSVRVAHRRLLSQHDAILSQEMKRAAEVGVVEVRRNPGFKPRTGTLQRATKGKVVRTKRGGIVRLQNAKRYAAPIDKGSRPHVIRARRGRALRFVSGGKLIFRRSVRHPGNRPFRFLSGALLTAYRSFEERTIARLTAAARNF